MPDLHVFLITCCFISSGLFALSCTKSFLSVCKLRKGFSAIAYFLTTVLMQVLGTAVCIFVFDCRYLVPTIVLVHFSVSLLFTDSLWRMRYYAAGVHAFLFTASRTIITKLLSIVTNKAAPIFTTETTSETTLVPIAVLTASFLVTCLLERIALNACTVDGARAPAFSPKMLNYLCVSVTLFLGFTLCEASINETHAGVRAFAFSHLCLCLLLYGGVWLLAKYHATITHISETKRSDTRRREERYYSYYITQAQTLE